MKPIVCHGDITTMNVDAIVNAANSELARGRGVCGAIFAAAGDDAERLQDECFSKAPVSPGAAALTNAYGLPARFIIHAVGPVYDPADAAGSERLLRSTYDAALTIADEHHMGSVAFPLISSGIYGYPYDDAMAIALDAMANHRNRNDRHMDVYLVLFDSPCETVSSWWRRAIGNVIAFILQRQRGRA